MASEFLAVIKARYATPTTVSLGRLFLLFLFPDLASFERTADLITHLRSLDSSYRAACTDAQFALLPPPMAITIYLIATSLPDRIASVRDTLLLKHPSELTIKVLESALKDVKRNLRLVASTSGAVPPPLFHGCTVPQLPTLTASLATATTDVTAAAVTTSSWSRGRSGRRGSQGAGGGGGGGGGDVASGGSGSAGAGGAPRAAADDYPAAAGGGDARIRQPPTGLPAAGGGAAACVSLFDLASGAAIAPPATADNVTRSQWLTRDAAARLAIRNHLTLAECTHFGQHRTAQALYDAVVARYSSPTTAALGRLLLPYLFPELSAFATIEDLVSHLHTSNARYHATVPAEDHFLSLDPTSLTIDLLEQHLFAAETSAVAVAAARGTPHPPFFEGCSLSPLAPSYASVAAVDVPGAEDVKADSASAKCGNGKGKGRRGGGGGSGSRGRGSGGGSGGSGGGGAGGSGGGSGGVGGGGGGGGVSGGTGGGGTGARRGGSGGGQRQQQQRRSKTQSPQQLREWFLQRGASGGSLSYPYVIRTGDRVGHTCGRLHTQHRCFSRLDDAWRAEFGDDIELPRWAYLLRSSVDIFDLDFDAIVSAMYALSVNAECDCYQYVPPDPGIAAAALGASESGTLPGTAPAEAMHTFMLDSSASAYFFRDSTTLTPLPAPVPVRLAHPSGGPVVACSSTVLSCQVAASCSCCLLSHQTLLWHHRLGHPSLPRLRGMHSHLLVFGLPRSLPPLPPSPALPCLPSLCRGAAARRSSLLLVSPDDCSPVDSPYGLRLQLRKRFGHDLLVLRLHSDRGGDFSSDVLRDFCHGEGILQSFTLPDSPQQNGIAERRIGFVMEVARTSMIHAAAPHFLWPFAVSYAAHQLNLWPHKLSPHAIPFYHLFPYRSAPPPPPPFFLAPGPPPVDPLLPQGPAPSGAPYGGAASGGAEPGGAESEGAGSGGVEPGGEEPGGAEPAGEEPGGAEPEGVELGGVESEGAECGGSEPQGAASSGGRAGALPRLSPEELREWFVRRARLQSGAIGAGGAEDAGAGGGGVIAGAGGTGGTAAAGL
ncbi:unnamed protein product [Closterium sp. NIES-54]